MFPKRFPAGAASLPASLIEAKFLDTSPPSQALCARSSRLIIRLMSDTARDDDRTIEPASIEGLEDLFGERLPVEVPKGVPADEAAVRLGLTVRAVLKRLRRGSLKGYKAPMKHGEKWFVLLEELPEGVLVQAAEVPLDRLEVPLNCEELPQEVLDGAGKFLEMIEGLQTKLDVANNQLQAASFRNGYLEAQLDTERQQVKLLMDSQHNASCWHRTWQWFIGTSP